MLRDGRLDHASVRGIKKHREERGWHAIDFNSVYSVNRVSKKMLLNISSVSGTRVKTIYGEQSVYFKFQVFWLVVE